MNKLLLVLLAVCTGAIGLGALRQTAERARMATAVRAEEWQAGTDRLAESQVMIAVLRAEVWEKKKRLGQARAHPDLSAALLDLLELNEDRPAAWAELRQQLGIGWESSPDYVLIRKRVINDLSYPKLQSAANPAEEACGLLALSPSEQSAIRSVLERTRAECPPRRVERAEPGGDIIAQYTLLASDPGSDQSVSNHFAAGIASAVGPERAELLLPQAWREFRTELGPAEAQTMTIRRSVVDGEADLICEMTRGSNVNTFPVRYAHYPAKWFLTLFPGGWKTLAEHEGFELPKRFQP